MAWLATACQIAVPTEEAKKVPASFTATPPSFVPPPRTIADVVATLDEYRRDEPEGLADTRALVDQAPPENADSRRLAQFYIRRGRAARSLGRVNQPVEDLAKAVEYAGAAGAVDLETRALFYLANAEDRGGSSFADSIGHLEAAAAKKATGQRRSLLITINATLARYYTLRGDLTRAQRALQEAKAVRASMRQDPSGDAEIALAEGWTTSLRGKYPEAEEFWREAVRIGAANPTLWDGRLVDHARGFVASALLHQGRLVEAEIEAREALLGTLRKFGRYGPFTAYAATGLARVMAEQGRYAEAEVLTRAAVEIYERASASEDSRAIAEARKALALALVGQGRWEDAVAEYDWIRQHTGDPVMVRRLLTDPDLVVALTHVGRLSEALQTCEQVIQRNERELGDADPKVLTFRGLRAAIHSELGDRARALREFAEVTRLLIVPVPEADDEASSRPARDQRLTFILTSYILLLTQVQGTPYATGGDAIAEAFRLAEVVRGRAAQRALDASALRAAAQTPVLATLVRREQDASKQLAALYGHLAALIIPTRASQDDLTLAQLRSEIDTLRRERATLMTDIRREFPTYAQLVRPSPATMAQVRAVLHTGESLISILVTPKRTLVWGVPQAGPVVFASVPVGESALSAIVIQLRRALDPGARTFGDIPEFDLAQAHDLYRELLAPVRGSWENAQSLLIVPHGALAQLPLELLPTRPVALGPEQGTLFSRYRSVPWLIRTHAVTVLPSAGALVTLRTARPSGSGRRPFVGFGDPYFSSEQARAAEADASTRATQASSDGTVPFRNIVLRLRSSMRLAMLPRLPDTADEIQSIAAILKADSGQDVFLGRRANEGVVKALDLAHYRVIAFATHGLMPGDLDGLTQPALALTAPEVAQVEGDGLLTLGEILALRLDADWVVLSACNTGTSAGSEAVSDLGRAFFYAGARALLVSRWPVETSSARALTTDLFRRQAARPHLTRAQALQETLNALIDNGLLTDPRAGHAIISYAHPIFWAPFALIGDGGR
jgi:CHAT domain-containing protein/tetratricopeptide (TPR) repeat protein